MNRRNFFATLLGGLLCKFLPKPVIKHRYPMWEGDGMDLGHDCSKMHCYLTDAEYGKYLRSKYGTPGMAPLLPPANIPLVKDLVFDEQHQVSVFFVTKKGYITAPSPSQWTAHVKDIPLGPPNIVARIVSFDD